MYLHVGTEASEKGGEVIRVCGKDGDNTVSFPFPLLLCTPYVTYATYMCSCVDSFSPSLSEGIC